MPGDTVIYALMSMFTPREFARWMVGREPLGSTLLESLPQVDQPADIYFSEVLGVLERHGLLRTHDFYLDLLAARPHRAADIADIAGSFGQEQARAVACEVDRHKVRSIARVPLLHRAGLQTLRIRQLDALVEQHRQPAEDRSKLEQQMEVLVQEILTGPCSSRPSDRYAARQIAVAPDATRALRLAGAVRDSSIALCVRTAVCTLVIGGTLTLTIYYLVQTFGGGFGTNVEIVGPTAPVVEGLSDPEQSFVREVRPQGLIDPAPESAVLAPAKHAPGIAHKPYSQRRSSVPGTMDLQRPRPVLAIPPLPSRLASTVVEYNVATALRPRDYSDLSLRLRVLPSGEVDADDLTLSSVYGLDHGLLWDRLVTLRFPPTTGGSERVLCYVLGDDEPTLKCGPS